MVVRCYPAKHAAPLLWPATFSLESGSHPPLSHMHLPLYAPVFSARYPLRSDRNKVVLSANSFLLVIPLTQSQDPISRKVPLRCSDTIQANPSNSLHPNANLSQRDNQQIRTDATSHSSLFLRDKAQPPHQSEPMGYPADANCCRIYARSPLQRNKADFSHTIIGTVAIA